MSEKRRPGGEEDRVTIVSSSEFDEDMPLPAVDELGRRLRTVDEIRGTLVWARVQMIESAQGLPPGFREEVLNTIRIDERDVEILGLLHIPEPSPLKRNTRDSQNIPDLMCNTLVRTFDDLCEAVRSGLGIDEITRTFIAIIGEPGSGKTWIRVLMIEFFERHLGIFGVYLQTVGIDHVTDFLSHDTAKQKFIASKKPEELARLGHDPKKLSSDGVRKGILDQINQELPEKISRSYMYFFEAVGIFEIEYLLKKYGMMYAFEVIKHITVREGSFENLPPIRVNLVATAGGPLLRLLLSCIREAIKTPAILYQVSARISREMKRPVIDEEQWLQGHTEGSLGVLATINYILEVSGLPPWTPGQLEANIREGATVTQIEMLEQVYLELLNHMLDASLIAPEEYIRLAVRQEAGTATHKQIQLPEQSERQAQDISDALGVELEVVRRKIGQEHALLHLYAFMVDVLQKHDKGVLGEVMIVLNNPTLGLDIKIPNPDLLLELLDLIERYRSKLNQEKGPKKFR